MKRTPRFLRLGCLTLQAVCVAVGVGMLMGQGCFPPSNTGNDTGGDVVTPAASPYLGAAGSDGCQLCHSSHFDNWSQTRHAKAFETLKAIGQDKNAECLPCHVVGYGETGGFVDEATTPRLAGVQCESCHGAAASHRANVDDATKRPLKSINSAVCGRCHTDVHHPTYDEWAESGHAKVTGAGATPSAPASYFFGGTNLNTCGVCHSGDFRELKFVDGQTTIADTLYKNVPTDQLNGVTCVTCHDPHRNTGNSAGADVGEDYQLRFPEIAFPVKSNTIADVTNSARLNLCGQCHRSRDTVWTSTSRGPHGSVQASFYYGEMPVPDGTSAIVANTNSVHLFAPKQCVTCHMQTEEFESEEAPADSGHTFELKTTGCSAVGCHPSEADAVTRMNALKTEIQTGLNAIVARLGPVSTWEYSSTEYGGPTSQTGISDAVKKVRFMYHYMLNEGSFGTHNPGYARAMLVQMDVLLKSVGK